MSWLQLKSIIDEGQAQAAWEASVYPVSCPNDGTPLLIGPDGHKYCPFDGYRP